MTPKVKICGIKDPESAQVAAAAGADYLGLVLNHEQSPRYLPPEKAAILIKESKVPETTQWVGLFVNPSAPVVIEACRLLDITIVQLHGQVTLKIVQEIRAANVQVWLAIPVNDLAEAKCARFKDDVNAFLLDTDDPDLYGGTGRTFSWEAVSGFKQYDVPIAVAGGLTPTNVQDCIRQANPEIVDVSSGVESQRGVKDEQLIREFIHRAKSRG